jgi:hypothetical protein
MAAISVVVTEFPCSLKDRKIERLKIEEREREEPGSR